MSERFVALYAVQLRGGGWFRFIGDTETRKLPMRSFFLECITFENWLGKEKPETAALCRKHGVDVLFRIHLDRTAGRSCANDCMELLFGAPI